MDIWTVADWFLKREAMDHSKLEGMVYLSYAWFYALHHQVLFETPGFEALPTYIAEPRLFEKYKASGHKKLMFQGDVNVGKEMDAFLESVYRIYAPADGEALSSYLRQSAPYQKARARQGDFRIALKDMQAYYERQVQSDD